MTGIININGLDAFTNYGVIVKRGNYSRLLKMPKRKSSGLDISFADQDGDDVFLGNPKFEAVSLILPFIMVASGESEFFNKYETFKALLMSAGELNFDFLKFSSSGRRFKLFYEDMTELNMLTRIKNTNIIACDFMLQLKNNYPTTNFTP